MLRRSTLFAAMLVLFASGAVHAAPGGPASPDVRSTLLLFVAAWCAPCHKELAVLPSLVEAAGPVRLLVVPLDSGAAKAAMMRKVPVEQRLDLGEQAGRDLFFTHSGLPLALPASVMIGADGRRCAQANRPLNPARVRELIASCRAASAQAASD